MRNIEVLRDYFLGHDPQLKETLSDNSLRLIGIPGSEFALMIDVRKLIHDLEEIMEASDLELAEKLSTLEDSFDAHRNNSLIHLSPEQIEKIEEAVTPAELASALATALDDYYTKSEIDSMISGGLKREVVQTLPVSDIKTNVIYMVPKSTATQEDYYDEYMYINGAWELIGSTQVDIDTATDQEISDTVDDVWDEDTPVDPGNANEILEDVVTEPTKVINSEWFYRFKNLVDNSSFEVFDGQTGIPYGWEGCTVSPEASMFGTYSAKIEQGDTAKVLSRNQPDVTWAQGAYDTEDLILSFYHKFGGVEVSVYDIENAEYLDIQKLNSTLEPVGTPAQVAQFPYKENWNRYRDYIKITPESDTERIRLEFHCPSSATSEVYIDGVSLEPFEEGEYPSIYKDGRYSISASMVLNPPPGDVDRFTYMEHFNIRNGVEDSNGFLTYQELAREDGTLAVTRQASNPDANGFYQTVVETFYKPDGVTPIYVDTYSYVFSSAGAIKQRTRTTTEV